MDEIGVVAPGPDAALCDLYAVNSELAALSDEELAAALQAWTAQRRHAEALCAAAAVAAFDRVGEQGYPVSGAEQTVAVLTGASTRSASHTLSVAATVTAEPVVWSALADGRIDTARARTIAEAFAEVPDPDRAGLIAATLEYAQTHTAYQTRRKAMRLLVDYDPTLGPEHTERERAKAWDDRCLRVFPGAHGMAEISGYLPAGTARILMAALDKVARAYHDDRTLDQKRVDALAEILAENTRLEVNVDVVIPADTLAGLTENGASVMGYGPVDAEDARSMALNADARWRRLITDPITGRLLDMSTGNYRIPAAMKAAVRARDRVCRFPGCTTDARYTDTDHVVPWPRGATDPTNLAPGCRGHHRVKTHSSWHCHTREDGALIWTSPLGTSHITHPWDYNNPDY
jgi:hypothetical protein